MSKLDGRGAVCRYRTLVSPFALTYVFVFTFVSQGQFRRIAVHMLYVQAPFTGPAPRRAWPWDPSQVMISIGGWPARPARKSFRFVSFVRARGLVA